MLDGVNIELKDAVKLVLPARTPGVEPGQYSRVYFKLFIRVCGLCKRRCRFPFSHTFSITFVMLN